jgi:hypothetical protein
MSARGGARPTTRLALAGALSLLLLVPAASTMSAASSRPSVVAALPGRTVKVRATHTAARHAPILPSVQSAGGVRPAAAATIQVTYNGFPVQAKAAFQTAVNRWANRIRSSQVIHVTANWTSLGPGVLGSAGPAAYYLLTDNHVYPAALAEAMCSCDAGPTEIVANFNSAFPSWYLGNDGNTPFDRYDFMTVVLHELGHGLGFLGSLGVSGSTAGWGFTDGFTVFPTRFDTHVWDSASGGTRLINTGTYPNPSASLKNQLTDGSVFFGGPHARSTIGNARARLYAPSPYAPGSSTSHLDEAAFPTGTINALMTPFLANGEVIHEPGPLTLGVFRDLGWVTNPDRPDIRISNVSKLEGHSGMVAFSLTVTLSAPTTGPVVVSWSTANGTAKAPGDYVAKSGSLTIPAGATSRVLQVSVKGDHAAEPNETFKVNLTRATGGGILDSQGIATIRNDD